MKPRPLGSKFWEDFKNDGVYLIIPRECWQITFVKLNGFCLLSKPTHISLPIGTNGKTLAAIGKFLSAIGKLMTGKTLASNGEEFTNAMICHDELAHYW